MSNQAITWALQTPAGGPANKVLLIALANYANEDHETYPSIARLSAETDMSVASVKRHLTDLCDRGLITRSARPGRSDGGRGRQTNRYRLNMERAQTEPKTLPAQTELQTTPPDPGLGLKTGMFRAQNGHVMGSTVSHEPIEPKEPKDIHDPIASFEADFDDWYRAYPKKVDPGSARRAYKTARRSASRDELLAGAQRMAERFPPSSDRTYCKGPAPWLRAQAWLNEDDLVGAGANGFAQNGWLA